MERRGPLITDTMQGGKSDSPTDETGSVQTASPDDAKEPAMGFLALGRRNLSEDEIASPAGRRFLIAEIERLYSEQEKLIKIRDQYWEQRVSLVRLEEAAKRSTISELMSYVCFSIGSVGLGAVPSFLAVNSTSVFGWTVLALSALLVGAGIVGRIFK